MKDNYDVIVVGAGPAGIFTCYELYEKSPELKVLLIDKGYDIYSRHCPILEKKIKKCPGSTAKKDHVGCYPACSVIRPISVSPSIVVSELKYYIGQKDRRSRCSSLFSAAVQTNIRVEVRWMRRKDT